MKTLKLICCTGALLGLGLMGVSGCSSPAVDTGSYDSSEAGKVNKVVPGTIMSERPVVINSQIPDDANTAASSNSNNNVPSDYTAENHTSGYEYIIKLDSGAMISVVQADTLQLKPRQKVLVIYGATTRVVADETQS